MSFLEYCKKYNVEISMFYNPIEDTYNFYFKYPNDFKQRYSFTLSWLMDLDPLDSFELTLTSQAEENYLAR